jgi:ribonucleoside-diphosphate reductase alpha chain
VRRRLPDERQAITHKFKVGGHEGYVTVGLFEDGTPGELFCIMSKEGSTISGLMDAFATAVSLALQYGVPLKVLVDKFSHMRFEPAGVTGNPQIPLAKSVCDYIFRWLGLKFLPEGERPFDPSQGETTSSASLGDPSTAVPHAPEASFVAQADAPPCAACGSIMTRSGACYRCENCGSTSGCS